MRFAARGNAILRQIEVGAGALLAAGDVHGGRTAVAHLTAGYVRSSDGGLCIAHRRSTRLLRIAHRCFTGLID